MKGERRQSEPVSRTAERKAQWGWALYDWANSAFATTVMAGFFPLFFKQYWSAGTDPVVSTAQLGFANAAAGLVVALCAPLLGALADQGQLRKRFLLLFAMTGAGATCGLFWVPEGGWPRAALLYCIGMIGFAGGNIFYDALLTAVATPEETDTLSSRGYALGYLGGGLLFAANVAGALAPATFGMTSAAQAVRLAFLSVGCWWFFFSLPLLLWVPENLRAPRPSPVALARRALAQFTETLRGVRRLKTIFLFLLAYWFYIDGVNTIIVMAVDYGLAIGFQSNDLILALLITQFIGFPSALVFGRLGHRLGTRRAILLAIAVYLLIPLWAALMHNRWEFYLMAGIIGLVQGGVQALSRSLFARMIPPARAAEYFGFFNMIGKFAVVIGPALLGSVALIVRALGYGNLAASRVSVLSVALLFLIGGLLLFRVDENRGRSEANRALTAAPAPQV